MFQRIRRRGGGRSFAHLRRFVKLKKFLDPRRHEPPEKNAFIFNIILGLTMILLFSFVLKDLRIKQELINRNFDNYLLWRLNADKDSFLDKYVLFGQAADEETRQVAGELRFLFFDDGGMEALGNPRLTPRDKLAYLIRTAYEGGASIIVVDQVLMEPDLTPKTLLKGDEVAMSGAQRDQILRDLLKTIRDDPNSNTKILLPRLTSANKDRIIQPTLFPDLVDGKKIIEVTPAFTEYRSNIRFWMPYLKANYLYTNEPRILWSIPVMTLALTYGNLDDLHALEQKILNDTNGEMDMFTLKVSRHGVEENFPIYEERYEDNGVMRDTQGDQYNRIQYVLYSGEFSSRNNINGNISDEHLHPWSQFGIKAENFECRDKIVIIGRTDGNCNDIKVTPVNLMPGMFVQANAIATVLSSNRPHICSMKLHLAIELLLVIFTAYLILKARRPIVGYLTLAMFAACWIGPFFYYCFTNEYIFLNMAFMSLGFYTFGRVLENLSWRGVAGLLNFISILSRR